VQYELEVNGNIRQVTVRRRDGLFLVRTGECEWTVDAAQVGGQMLSLLIKRAVAPQPHKSTEEAAQQGRAGADHSMAGAGIVESREVSVARDPVTGDYVFGVGTMPIAVGLNTRRRMGRRGEAADGGLGPQRILAPMPGKILRVLARPGESVLERQPVIVIEAMKMENELRAARDGSVTEVLVAEGQSVEAGMLLAILTPA